MYTNKQICLLNVNQAISCYRDPNPFFFAQGIMKYILFQYPWDTETDLTKRTLSQKKKKKFFLDYVLSQTLYLR